MKKKKLLLYILKAFISILLLAIIIKNIDWNQISANIDRANYFFLSTAFILNIVERILLTYKWQILIRARGILVSFGRLFLINSIGVFWGLFLPSSVSTDVVRGYYLVKNNSEKSISVSSVFVDRILGLFSLFLIGVLAISFSNEFNEFKNLKLNIYILVVIIFILFYLFQREKTAGWIKHIFTKIRYKKITDPLIKLHQSVLEYKKYPKTLALSFSANLVVQLTRILTYYLIAISFNIYIPVFYFVLFIPVIMLALMLPISIGGLGVREGMFIAFFSLVGISLNDSIIISFTNTLINTLNTLIGGLAFLFYHNPDKSPAILDNSKLQ